MAHLSDFESPAQPIAAVLFVHESGYVESHKVADIRANPELFRAILAEHRSEGRKPLALRSAAPFQAAA